MFGTEGHEKELLCEFLIAAVVSNSTSYLPKVLEVSEVFVKSKDSFPCLISLSSLIRASSSGFKAHCSDLSAWHQPQLSPHLGSQHPRAPAVPSGRSRMIFRLSILNLILSGKVGDSMHSQLWRLGRGHLQGHRSAYHRC